jgi:aminoglycoside phosphotransferase (APT) family kinase protein
MSKIPSLERATVGSAKSIIRQVHWWRRVWEEDRFDDEPLMELAYQWLIRNAPMLDHASLVHGDCRGGNILFTEHDSQITAWLDWELAVFGDRHQDLAWSMMDVFRHAAEDGKTMLISGFFPESEYLEIYESASHLSVNRKRLEYFRLMCSYMSVVICSATACRVVRGGKTHQDVVSTWLSMLGPLMFGQLLTILEEVA